MSSLNDQFLLIQALIYLNKQDYDKKMKKQDSKLNKLISLVINKIHHNKNYSLKKVESPNTKGSDTSYLVLDTFTAFK